MTHFFLTRFVKALVATTLLCVAATAAAQPLSLKDCITRGLDRNYDLRIVRNEAQAAANNATKAHAGYLPTLTAQGGYNASLDSRNTRLRSGGTERERNIAAHGGSAGVFAEWTLFDGFKIQTNLQRLRELKAQSETRTRTAIEDYVADVVAEYYNLVQQRIRMRNLRYAVSLSNERLRIVQERWLIGDNSRLDLQQAQVDFNADSAQSLKQREVITSARIRLNELMAENEVNGKLRVRDTVIDVNEHLNFDSLWAATLRTNSRLIQAAQNRTLAEIDLKSVKSRDYPYVRLNGNYGYDYNHYGSGGNRARHNWGGSVGVTVGMKLFDGNRRRERANAQLDIANAELAEQNVMLALKADLSDLWQAYQNNLRLLNLEKENLVTAQENHFIACERYMLGDLPGIEMREAQKSLLDAEERILVAQYNTKICEISLMQISGGIMRYLDE